MTRTLARISQRISSRGRRGAAPSGVFDPRGAERVLTVRRAPRGEKTPLGAMHRRPQQKAGEICGLIDGNGLVPDQLFRIGQVLGTLEPEVNEKLLGGPVEERFSDNLLAPGHSQKFALEQCPDHTR